MEHYNKILILSLAGIGDTLCITPLIEELRANFPKSVIEVLVMWDSSRRVLEHNPQVNKVYQFNMIQNGFLKTLEFCSKLKRNGYDLSINTYPQSKIHYRVISRLIHSKKRISHMYDHHGFMDSLLQTHEIPQNYKIPFIENNLNLLKSLGKTMKNKDHSYKLYFSKENEIFAKDFIKNNKLNKKALFGISTGSGSTKNLALRKWPLRHYESLIRKILDSKKNIHFLLFAGPEELEENKKLLDRLDSKRVSLVQSENIMDVVKLVGKCKFFISMDNVMMHFAAALKITRQIVVQTPTLNHTSKPYRKEFILVGKKIPRGMGYRYDGRGIYGGNQRIKDYMESITPEEVYEKIKKFL